MQHFESYITKSSFYGKMHKIALFHKKFAKLRHAKIEIWSRWFASRRVKSEGRSVELLLPSEFPRGIKSKGAKSCMGAVRGFKKPRVNGACSPLGPFGRLPPARAPLTLETLMSILTLILKRRSVSRYTCLSELESNRFAIDATLTDAFSVVTHLMIRFDTSFRYDAFQLSVLRVFNGWIVNKY